VQHLRSCYRCKTSPHQIIEKQEVDFVASQFLFFYLGLPWHYSTSTKGSSKDQSIRHLFPLLCSVARCEEWIEANPVLGSPKSRPGISTAGLQACYACQRDASGSTATAVSRHIYAKLASIMLHTAGQPAAQPAYISSSSASETIAIEMASSEATTKACWVCLISLHARLRAWNLPAAKQLGDCYTCFTSLDTYEDTKHMFSSKAATAYCKQTWRGGCSSNIHRMNVIGTAAAALQRLLVSSSSSNGYADTHVSGPVNAKAPDLSCSLCLDWLSRQQHPCKESWLRPIAAGGAGTAAHCQRCLSSSSSNDDDYGTALYRATVHHHMTCMLLDICVPQPAVLQLWALGWAKVQGGDHRQHHVVLAPAELDNAHAFFDAVLDSVIQSYSAYSVLSFDFDSSVATVALVLIVLLLAGPSMLAARQRGDSSRRGRRRSTCAVQRCTAAAAKLLFSAVCRVACCAARVLFWIWKIIACRVVGWMCYTVMWFTILYYLQWVPYMAGLWTGLKQQQELDTVIHLLLISCGFEYEQPVVETAASVISWLFGVLKSAAQVDQGSTAVPSSLQQQQQQQWSTPHAQHLSRDILSPPYVTCCALQVIVFCMALCVASAAFPGQR
jgi:hypothetical protein